ncbi:double zinc ribbon domain-containing protein, partial [Akkermansiaceae bacterium]|nr:double zinc ribbon domain-containing protein [Akkermansiaceae bacterium]
MSKRDRNTVGIFSRFLDLLYPAVCEICQVPLKHGYSLCQDCRNEIPRIISPFCKKCGEPFDGNINAEFRCQNCDGLKADFSFARASLRGLSLSFRLVHGLKYQRQFFLARELA